MPTIFVLGDSISIQYGPFLQVYIEPALSYARKDGTEAALQNLDIPTGANGGDSTRCLNYLNARCAEATFRPDLLLLNCGLHDIKRDVDSKQIQVDADTYRSNLQVITTLLAKRGTKLLWIRTTPVNDEIHNSRSKQFHRHDADQRAFNAIADQVMSDANVQTLDLDAFTRASGGDAAFSDHVHFIEPVRQAQGAFIAGTLRQMFR